MAEVIKVYYIFPISISISLLFAVKPGFNIKLSLLLSFALPFLIDIKFWNILCSDLLSRVDPVEFTAKFGVDIAEAQTLVEVGRIG